MVEGEAPNTANADQETPILRGITLLHNRCVTGCGGDSGGGQGQGAAARPPAAVPAGAPFQKEAMDYKPGFRILRARSVALLCA